MAENGYVTNKTLGLASRVEGVSWGGAWTGLVVGLAFMFLWTSLWAAIGYGSDVGFFTGTALGWWVAATAVVSVWVGSFAGAWVGRVEHPTTAMLTGLTVWALFTLAMAVFGDGMARAAGVIAPADVQAGSLQAMLGASTYFVFATTAASAIAAAIGGPQAAKLVARRRPAAADGGAAVEGILPHAHVIDVRDASAASARSGS